MGGNQSKGNPKRGTIGLRPVERRISRCDGDSGSLDERTTSENSSLGPGVEYVSVLTPFPNQDPPSQSRRGASSGNESRDETSGTVHESQGSNLRHSVISDFLSIPAQDGNGNDAELLGVTRADLPTPHGRGSSQPEPLPSTDMVTAEARILPGNIPVEDAGVQGNKVDHEHSVDALTVGNVFNSRYTIAARTRDPHRFHVVDAKHDKNIFLSFYMDSSEFEMMLGIHHRLKSEKRVCRLVDCGQSSNRYPSYTVTERGESTLQNLSLDVNDLTKKGILKDVLESILWMHENEVFHGNLNPMNVAWDSRSFSWRVDLDIVPRTGEVKPFHYAERYAAPEIIEAAKSGGKSIAPGLPADMWAFGMIVLKLLKGGCSHVDNVHLDIGEGSSHKSQLDPVIEVGDVHARELLTNVLRTNPSERWTADQVARCAFFRAHNPGLSHNASYEIGLTRPIDRDSEMWSQNYAMQVDVERFFRRSNPAYPFYNRTKKTYLEKSDLLECPAHILKAGEKFVLRISVTHKHNMTPLGVQKIEKVRITPRDGESICLDTEETEITSAKHEVAVLVDPDDFKSRAISTPSTLFGGVHRQYVQLRVTMTLVFGSDARSKVDMSADIYLQIHPHSSLMLRGRLAAVRHSLWACLPQCGRDFLRAWKAVAEHVPFA